MHLQYYILDVMGDFEGPGSKFATDTAAQAMAFGPELFPPDLCELLADWAATKVRILLRDSTNVDKDHVFSFPAWSPTARIKIRVNPMHFKDGIGGDDALTGVDRFRDLLPEDLASMNRRLELSSGTKTALGRIFVNLPVFVDRGEEDDDSHEVRVVLFLVDLLSPRTYLRPATMSTLGATTPRGESAVSFRSLLHTSHIFFTSLWVWVLGCRGGVGWGRTGAICVKICGVSIMAYTSPLPYQDVNVLGYDYLSWSRCRLVVDYSVVDGVELTSRASSMR
jgi:hypothetical protein